MRISNISFGLLAAIAGLLCVAPEALHAQKSSMRGSTDTITTRSGLKYVVTRQGKGKKPKKGDLAIVHYTGTLLDGTMFDSSRDREPFAFRLGQGQVIKGWDEGISRLKIGDRATFVIPANLAYGEREITSIPKNSTLVFDVELLDVAGKSVGDELTKAMDKNGADGAWKTYNQLKKNGFKGVHLSEGEINGLGYKYMQGGKLDQAIAIFKINVDAFPKSYNVYDSIGEAYLANGDRQLALENYQRSLELNAKNDNATQMLKMINEGPKNEQSGQ